MSNITLKKATVKTAAEIYEAFLNEKYIEIRPGTYDFSGITTLLTLDNGMKIDFIGEVIFQNVRIKTRTAVNSEYDGDSWMHTASWSAPSWAISADTWAPSSDWMIFVRDTWYEIDSYTGTTITPVIAYNGPALAGHRYVLCKPTKNVTVNGNLRMECDDSPGPSYVSLYGLNLSDVENWNLHVTRASASSIDYPGPAPVALWCMAMQTTPRISVSNFSWTITGNTYTIGIHLAYNQHIKGKLSAGHLEVDDDLYACGCYGIYAELCDYINLNCNVSGIFRNGVGTGDTTNIFAANSCDYSLFSGMSIAPFSAPGVENYYIDSGSNNSWDLITLAA